MIVDRKYIAKIIEKETLQYINELIHKETASLLTEINIIGTIVKLSKGFADDGLKFFDDIIRASDDLVKKMPRKTAGGEGLKAALKQKVVDITDLIKASGESIKQNLKNIMRTSVGSAGPRATVREMYEKLLLSFDDITGELNNLIVMHRQSITKLEDAMEVVVQRVTRQGVAAGSELDQVLSLVTHQYTKRIQARVEQIAKLQSKAAESAEAAALLRKQRATIEKAWERGSGPFPSQVKMLKKQGTSADDIAKLKADYMDSKLKKVINKFTEGDAFGVKAVDDIVKPVGITGRPKVPDIMKGKKPTPEAPGGGAGATAAAEQAVAQTTLLRNLLWVSAASVGGYKVVEKIDKWVMDSPAVKAAEDGVKIAADGLQTTKDAGEARAQAPQYRDFNEQVRRQKWKNWGHEGKTLILDYAKVGNNFNTVYGKGPWPKNADQGIFQDRGENKTEFPPGKLMVEIIAPKFVELGDALKELVTAQAASRRSATQLLVERIDDINKFVNKYIGMGGRGKGAKEWPALKSYIEETYRRLLKERYGNAYELWAQLAYIAFLSQMTGIGDGQGLVEDFDTSKISTVRGKNKWIYTPACNTYDKIVAKAGKNGEQLLKTMTTDKAGIWTEKYYEDQLAAIEKAQAANQPVDGINARLGKTSPRNQYIWKSAGLKGKKGAGQLGAMKNMLKVAGRLCAGEGYDISNQTKQGKWLMKIYNKATGVVGKATEKLTPSTVERVKDAAGDVIEKGKEIWGDL